MGLTFDEASELKLRGELQFTADSTNDRGWVPIRSSHGDLSNLWDTYGPTCFRRDPAARDRWWT